MYVQENEWLCCNWWAGSLLLKLEKWRLRSGLKNIDSSDNKMQDDQWKKPGFHFLAVSVSCDSTVCHFFYTHIYGQM